MDKLTEQEALDIWNETETPEPTEQEPRGEMPPNAEEPAAQPAPTQEAEDDPFEGFSPRAKEYIVGQQAVIEQLRTQTEALHGRVRNTEGHIGGLKSQLERAATAARDTGTESPSNAEIREAIASPEALKQFREDYPEIAKAVDLAISERVSTLPRPAPASNNEIEALRNQIAQLERQRAMDFIESRHEGWVETIRTPEFQGWVKSVPREVAALGDSNDPRDAVRMLDLFRQGRAKPTQRQSSAAAIPSGRGAPSRRVKNVDEMSDAEYWAHLDATDK